MMRTWSRSEILNAVTLGCFVWPYVFWWLRWMTQFIDRSDPSSVLGYLVVAVWSLVVSGHYFLKICGPAVDKERASG